MIISGVYLITNTINGKLYVGSAADIVKRWQWHKRYLMLNKHHSILLQRSYNKYGEDAFDYAIVEECLPEKLLEIEQLWLDASNSYNPEKGYNIFPIAGSPRGYKHTEEWKQNNSRLMRGRKHSEETKANMSKVHSNRSWEHRLNQAAAMKKRGITPEHKQKLKEANIKRGYKFK